MKHAACLGEWILRNWRWLARREACLRSPARATTIDAGGNVFHHCKADLTSRMYKTLRHNDVVTQKRGYGGRGPATGIKKKSWPRVHAAASEVVRTAPRCRYWGALIRTTSREASASTNGATLPLNNNVHLSMLLCKQEKSRHGAEQEESQESQEIFDR